VRARRIAAEVGGSRAIHLGSGDVLVRLSWREEEGFRRRVVVRTAQTSIEDEEESRSRSLVAESLGRPTTAGSRGVQGGGAREGGGEYKA
jgi:hypothetical protein